VFGVCVVGTSGRIYGAGDKLRIFYHERVEAVRVCAICETIGAEQARAKLGANRTSIQLSCGN
jgi:glutaminase